MSNNQKPSVKSIILYGLAIIVVAFVGVLAGNWFVNWRQGDQQSAAYGDVNMSLLKIGEAFPVEELVDLDSNIVSTGDFAAGKPALILFISPGCEPCKMALDVWAGEIPEISDKVSVFAIAAGDVSDIVAYKAKIGVDFPVYCDVDYLFPQQYDITSFPSIVGVTKNRLVAFVVHGYSEDFTLADAYERFEK